MHAAGAFSIGGRLRRRVRGERNVAEELIPVAQRHKVQVEIGEEEADTVLVEMARDDPVFAQHLNKRLRTHGALCAGAVSRVLNECLVQEDSVAGDELASRGSLSSACIAMRRRSMRPPMADACSTRPSNCWYPRGDALILELCQQRLHQSVVDWRS